MALNPVRVKEKEKTKNRGDVVMQLDSGPKKEVPPLESEEVEPAEATEAIDQDEKRATYKLWRTVEYEGYVINVRLFDWDLYRPDYTIVLAGRRRTGKTTFVKGFLKAVRPFFPRVLVFTKSTADCEYRNFIPDKYIIEGMDDKILANVIKQQKHDLKEYRKGKLQKNINLLVIIDDCMSDGLRMVKSLDELFYEGRHIKISVVVTMQYIKAIPPALRDNADLLVCFPTGKKKK